MRPSPYLWALLALWAAACAAIRPKPVPRTFDASYPSLRTPLDLRLQSPPKHALDFDPSTLRVLLPVSISAGLAVRLVDLYAYVAERRVLAPADPVILVLGYSQTLWLLCRNGQDLSVDSVFKVSTGTRGFAVCEIKELDTTPTGLHVVYDKQGQGLPPGRIMKARLDTGEQAVISVDAGQPVYASVTTRTLWLSGREPCNHDSYENLIYIHGTPREYSLGTPDSWGCVRMANWDVIRLFDWVPDGAPVYIDPRPAPKD